MSRLYLEASRLDRPRLGALRVRRSGIKSFRFDPQPFHLDQRARPIVRGLARADGTPPPMTMRLLVESD